ncbi:MAG: SHOCT domain-containing protein [Rhodospirillales bacterium]|nr:SHOCT domain-containing protein [Rhodospirillales bacterium]
MKTVVVRIAAAALALAPFAALAAPAGGREGYYGHGPMMWDGGWGWGHLIFGPLTMILVIAAVVGVVVLVVRWLGGPVGTSPSARGRTALDILEERYAKGEIDTKEFEERKKALGG